MLSKIHVVVALGNAVLLVVKNRIIKHVIENDVEANGVITLTEMKENRFGSVELALSSPVVMPVPVTSMLQAVVVKVRQLVDVKEHVLIAKRGVGEVQPLIHLLRANSAEDYAEGG